MSELARRVLETSAGGTQQIDGPFRCRKGCLPGSTGTILLSFTAPAGPTAVEMHFEPGDLTSRDGAVLPADRVNVVPSHVRIEPGEAVDVAINLTAHDLAEPGQYRGRIHCTGAEPTAIVVVFEVEER